MVRGLFLDYEVLVSLRGGGGGGGVWVGCRIAAGAVSLLGEPGGGFWVLSAGRSGLGGRV